MVSKTDVDPFLAPYYHLGQDSNYPKPNFDFSVLVDEGPYGSNEHVNVQVRLLSLLLSLSPL